MQDKDTKKEFNYWRGFRELHNDPDFQKAKEDEFEEGVVGNTDSKGASAVSRRTFLALMASSAALAATACSDYRDKGAIVPYNKKPEEITVGNPNFYASTCTACPNHCGILIKTREGRPVKIDGNPDHPVNKGKICAVGQANILNLYDPSRIKEPMFRTGADNFVPSNWADADKTIIDELKKASAAGKEIAVISHMVASPSFKNLFDDFVKAYPSAKLYSYELVSGVNKQSAFKKSFGKDGVPVIKWNEAKIILSVECDFLGKEGNFVEAQRLFTESRDVMNKDGEFNRLYTVEGGFSLTGANSDYRIRLKTDAAEEFVYALLAAVEAGSPLVEISKRHNIKIEILNELVKDLKVNRGKAIVTGGAKLPESAHIAINKLNDVLGASKLYSEEFYSVPVLSLTQKSEWESFMSKLNAGGVGVVIHFDTNPVFHFSPDYKYADALKKADYVVTMCESINESALHSSYALAINHNFESWGDYKTRTGVMSLQQPVIAPIYKTRQKEAVLLYWMSEKPVEFAENSYMNYIKSYWEKNVYPLLSAKTDFKNFWFNSLHDGVIVTKEKFDTNYTFKNEAFSPSPALSPTLRSNAGFTVVLNKSNFIGDGRFANNGWLQEIPSPISKVVWDNYAALSPVTAEKLGVSSNDLVKVSAGGKTLTLPALVQPGLADNLVSIDLGYGRTAAGPIGNGAGFNAIILISNNAAISPWLYTEGKVTKATGTYELITTQEHYPIDNERYNDIHLKREIIQEGYYEEYKENPKFFKEEKHETKLFNIVPSYDFVTNKWAMSIDLNRCTGCNYCVAACNVENNIPTVGKEQVKKNREMMWMRIDRYYTGHSAEPKIAFQPMLCQHCDNAPCENVCPVAATNHSPDGLNQMAYNRCVGTRYCSNNCPYKVRRYNYFNFRNNLADGYYEQDSLSLMHNPEVTVRSRGVMEKCTFCVQRIMEERQHATEQARPLNGDNIKTACQEACPTNAIVFGDLTKKDSEIDKRRNHELGYHVLEEINVRPNVTYIAKLRNEVRTINNKPENKS